jgi:tetratricopeptide (TPR) repeat protein
MRLSYTLYIGLLLCLVSATSRGQETVDTTELSKAGKNAQADALYFEALKAKEKNDDEAAIKLFELYAAKRPDVSVSFFELSRLYYSSKKTELALTNIKKALALEPANKWFTEELAVILAEMGKYEDAANAMAALADKDLVDQSYAIIASEYYERAHKYNEAIVYLDKAMKRSSADEEILMRKKVQLYLNLNNVEKAAATVQEMINKEPRNGVYYKFLGEMYDNNKLSAKATEVYERAKKLIPNDPAVQMGIAEHYLKTGDTVAYKTYVKKAIGNSSLDADDQVELLKDYIQTFPDEAVAIREGMPIIHDLVIQHPDNASILGLYGDFLEGSNQHDSAVLYFKRAVQVKPSEFDSWRKLLTNFTDKKDADSLIRYSEKAMKLFPNQAMVHYFNGVGHYNKKEYASAVNAVNRAIDMQPETNKALLAAMYSTLGDIHHSSKQDNLSDEAFAKALQMEPNDASVLNNFSYYLSERGVKLDSAEKMSKRSLELRPNEGTYLDTYGWILYKKGNYEKARDYVQKAIDLNVDRADATLYEHLGDIYYKLNNKAKALENWRIAKQKGGDDPQLDKKINDGKLYE